MTQAINILEPHSGPRVTNHDEARVARAEVLAKSYLHNGASGALRALVAVFHAERKALDINIDGNIKRREALARITGSLTRDSQMLDMMEAAEPVLTAAIGCEYRGWELAEHLVRNVMCAEPAGAADLHRRLVAKMEWQRTKFAVELTDEEIAHASTSMVDAWRRDEVTS